MRFDKNSAHTLYTPVEEFLDGSFQNVSVLPVASAFGRADAGTEGLTFQTASWHKDVSTDPDSYTVMTELGAGTAHPLERGIWMHYIELDGQVFEAGVHEVF